MNTNIRVISLGRQARCFLSVGALMLVACSSTERSGPTASSPPELSTQLLGQARPARPLRGDAAYAAPTAQAQPLDPLWETVDSMGTARVGHTATLLSFWKGARRGGI